MKLFSFRVSGTDTFGGWTQGGIVELRKRLGNTYADLRDVLRANALNELERALAGASPDYREEEVEFLPVITNPSKILCIGVNYDTHRQEVGRERTEKPIVFTRFANSQVGHGQPIVLPPESNDLDYEGEIAVIIGKAGRRIPQARAWEHIAGYAAYNDASVRDWQRHTVQWTPGKNFCRTGGFGPWMVTRDEIPDGAELHLATRLNGVEVQRTTTAFMIFSIPEIITYCSTFTELEPGDVIATGTPGGVGFKRTPPLFMKHGDVVEVEVSRIGVLRNPIAREA